MNMCVLTLGVRIFRQLFLFTAAAGPLIRNVMSDHSNDLDCPQGVAGDYTWTVYDDGDYDDENHVGITFVCHGRTSQVRADL